LYTDRHLLVAGPLAAVRVVFTILAEPAATTRDEHSGANRLQHLLSEVEQAFVVRLATTGHLNIDVRVLRAEKRDEPQIPRRTPVEELEGIRVRSQLDVVGKIPSVDTSKPAIRGQAKTGHRSGRSRPDVL